MAASLNKLELNYLSTFKTCSFLEKNEYIQKEKDTDVK
jgi:hypothetical protein